MALSFSIPLGSVLGEVINGVVGGSSKMDVISGMALNVFLA